MGGIPTLFPPHAEKLHMVNGYGVAPRLRNEANDECHPPRKGTCTANPPSSALQTGPHNTPRARAAVARNTFADADRCSQGVIIQVVLVRDRNRHWASGVGMQVCDRCPASHLPLSPKEGKRRRCIPLIDVKIHETTLPRQAPRAGHRRGKVTLQILFAVF